MRILAFDTCFGACSVAVADVENGAIRLHASRHNPMQRGHAEALMPMIDAVMADAGLPIASVDRIAVTSGPGTFTGVRVCIATARALALGLACDCVGLPTLEVIANGAADVDEIPQDSPFAVALDARRDQVYLQTFTHASGRAAPLMEAPRVLDPQRAALELADTIIVVGSGGPIIAATGTNLLNCLATDIQPDARNMLTFAATQPVPKEPVSPLYLRDPDAKPQTGFALERV